MIQRSAVYVLTAMAAMCLAAAPTKAAQLNNGAGGLQVFQNNVENLQIDPAGQNDDYCAPGYPSVGSIDRIVYPMAGQTFAPDVATIQQVNGDVAGRQQARLLAARMEQLFSPDGDSDYQVVVADPKPINEIDGWTCANKKYQTNAIIYRSDRLTVLKQGTYRSVGRSNSCLDDNLSDRTVNLWVLFRDNVTGKKVKVTSFHWPKGYSYCAWVNGGNLSSYRKSEPADLEIAGGDANAQKTDCGPCWFDNLLSDRWRDISATIDFAFTRRNPSTAGLWLVYGPVQPYVIDYGGGHPAIGGYAVY